MRKIAIIGAGQAGLQLALGLLQNNFRVSLFSNRTAEQILDGKILSSQGMFHSALAHEAALGLDFWRDQAPCNQAVTFSLLSPETHERAIFWQGSTKMHYASIDQRMKFSCWIGEFIRSGGNLYVKDVQQNDLEEIALAHDLTIVASGKGEIGKIFPKNKDRCQFSEPPRKLACLYVQNTIPAIGKPGVRANILPGIGEYFIMPGLTINGFCEMMLFEGIPDGPFDCWQAITSVEQQLEVAKGLLKEFVPLEYERCKDATVADEKAGLIGAYVPYVRHPCVRMKNGKHVFAMGDAVVLNDPIAGQGANSASKAAHAYLLSILEHDSLHFDESWMQETFEKYWDRHAKWATQWTNLLLMPPPPHVISLLGAASNSTLLANKLADGFDDPSLLFPWIMSESDTSRAITEAIGEEKSTV